MQNKALKILQFPFVMELECSPPVDLIPNQQSPVHIITTYFCEVCFIISILSLLPIGLQTKSAYPSFVFQRILFFLTISSCFISP